MKSQTLRLFALALLSVSMVACSPATTIAGAQRTVQDGLHQVQSRLPFLRGVGITAPAGSQEAAIQLVIMRGNFEQEQAIASRDSSVMKDTTTDAHYQQVAQDNQDMIDGGVTSIKLVGLDWGPIQVNGSQATATTYETWTSQFSDGSTDQSRDRNVYRLVQQNGVWKIDADDHPDSDLGQPSAPASPGGGSPAPSRPSPGTGAAPSGRGRGAQPSSGASPAVTAAPGSPEAAVEQVILRGNQEQEQAIASKDSSVMKDTSTDTYYQDLSQVNQDMIDGGITAIKLIGLDWGQVSIDGSNATATTFETWSTTYNDGSTDQSRDRNVYTLVLQNGSWKIQADDHPDDTFIPPPGAPGSGSGSPSPSPRVPSAPAGAGRGQSVNWSGYAASGGKFTGVSGTWTVPQPSGAGAVGADAAWVGIGGLRSRDLLQAGTEETVLSTGRTRYNAWIEMLPQFSHPVPLPVHPGDSVTVSITQQPDGSWQVAFKNNTTGATYDRTVQYDSSFSSAEWIEEAPSSGRGGVVPIDNFGAVAFTNATAVKDGKTVNLRDAQASPITMINGNRQPLASPSGIGQDGASFTVTRTGNSAGAGQSGGRARPAA